LLTHTPHPVDRRKTVVKVTPQGAKRCYRLIAPHIADGKKELGDKYSVKELRLIADFLRTSTAIQNRHTQRLRALPTPGRRTPTARKEP